MARKDVGRLERSITEEGVGIFRSENMTHKSAEDYFPLIGVSAKNYMPTNLTAEYSGQPSKELAEYTELRLAENAMKRGCEYVTDIDYCAYEPDAGKVLIKATGWKAR